MKKAARKGGLICFWMNLDPKAKGLREARRRAGAYARFPEFAGANSERRPLTDPTDQLMGSVT
jgi:hypothetical protein